MFQDDYVQISLFFNSKQETISSKGSYEVSEEIQNTIRQSSRLLFENYQKTNDYPLLLFWFLKTDKSTIVIYPVFKTDAELVLTLLKNKQLTEVIEAYSELPCYDTTTKGLAYMEEYLKNKRAGGINKIVDAPYPLS